MSLLCIVKRKRKWVRVIEGPGEVCGCDDIVIAAPVTQQVALHHGLVAAVTRCSRAFFDRTWCDKGRLLHRGSGRVSRTEAESEATGPIDRSFMRSHFRDRRQHQQAATAPAVAAVAAPHFPALLALVLLLRLHLRPLHMQTTDSRTWHRRTHTHTDAHTRAHTRPHTKTLTPQVNHTCTRQPKRRLWGCLGKRTVKSSACPFWAVAKPIPAVFHAGSVASPLGSCRHRDLTRAFQCHDIIIRTTQASTRVCDSSKGDPRTASVACLRSLFPSSPSQV